MTHIDKYCKERGIDVRVDHGGTGRERHPGSVAIPGSPDGLAACFADTACCQQQG